MFNEYATNLDSHFGNWRQQIIDMDGLRQAGN